MGEIRLSPHQSSPSGLNQENMHVVDARTIPQGVFFDETLQYWFLIRYICDIANALVKQPLADFQPHSRISHYISVPESVIGEVAALIIGRE